jgi:hypothetical protein
MCQQCIIILVNSQWPTSQVSAHNFLSTLREILVTGIGPVSFEVYPQVSFTSVSSSIKLDLQRYCMYVYVVENLRIGILA